MFSKCKKIIEKSSEGNEESSKIKSLKNKIRVKERYEKILESAIVDKLLTVAYDKLDDDDFISMLFEKAYDLLPTPIRLVVKRDWCIKYLSQHKDKISNKVRDIQLNRMTSCTVTEDGADELSHK